MAFRGFEPGGPEHLRDPIARFEAIDAALEQHRGLFADRTPQRLAAINLILTPGDPEQLAGAVDWLGDRLHERVGLALGHKVMHPLIASSLVRHGDGVDGMLAEYQRIRPKMRELGFRWSPMFEFIAVLAMRMHRRGPIPDEQLQRMRDIYEAMREHHWWLTGPDDFPACALLTTRSGSPGELADRAHEVYELLRHRLGASRGDALQMVSNTLALAEATPLELCGRFESLHAAFTAAGRSPGTAWFDELALLSFLPRPSEMIVETVLAYEQKLREHVKWYERTFGFMFAANLAFVHVVGYDPNLGALADVKALLDMLWVIQQNG